MNLRLPTPPVTARPAATALALLAAFGLAACGSATNAVTAPTHSTPTSPNATQAPLPGTGRPQVNIGDKNFTEQFVLGELYAQALRAQGFTVLLNRNIGPTEVTIQALQSARLDMYPEYLSTWNTAVARNQRSFASVRAAYRAGQRYALAHGLELLAPTPFSNTDAIGLRPAFATENNLTTLGDLRRVAPTLTLGAPAQPQQSTSGLSAIEQAYGFVPATVKPLEIGGQYQALDQGSVQAADIKTTDGQLASGHYVLLRDPRKAFGWGNVVPVVSAKVLLAEGPAFAATIDRVSGLLTPSVMRRLNAAVDISNQDPVAVAKQFLQAHGLVPATAS